MVSHMRLLSGSPFKLDNITVYQPTLRDIDNMGDDFYNTLFRTLLVDKEALKGNENYNQEVLGVVSEFELFMELNKQDDMFRETVKQSLLLFTGEEFFYDGDYLKAFVKSDDPNSEELNIEVYLDENLLEQLRSAIKQINYVPDQNSNGSFNPANDKAKALKERLEKTKQKVKEDNKEENIRLSDIVSIVSNYSNDLNILNVWDLTVFQLYECYVRILVWDDYHIGQQHVPHMDEKSQKEVRKSHWVKKVSPNIFKEEK